MKRRVFIAGIILFAALGIGASADEAAAQPSPASLDGLTPDQLMSLADQWGMNSEENKMTIWTSSRAFNFVFADGSRTVTAMPDDRMVVSIAPYVMKTHPCRGHYPSTCRGELVSTPVHVVAVTSEGRKLLDVNTTTLQNGFVDVWLPRDLRVDVTMEARGLKATERIGTSDEDNTCVTALKLHY